MGCSFARIEVGGALLSHGTSRRAHSQSRLEAVVDPPLQPGQGADHEDARPKAFEHQVLEADLGRDLTHGFVLVLGLTHETHQRVGGVRYDGTKDPGQVSGGKGHTQLRRLVVCVLGLGEDVRVKAFHNLLEEEELGDGVGDLPGPQRGEAPKGESRLGRVGSHFLQRWAKGGGERPLGRCLDLHFDHFEGAQENVSHKFGRPGRRRIDYSPVLVRRLFTQRGRIKILKEFVQSELASPLQTVADCSRSPALDQSIKSLLLQDGPNPTDQSRVLGRVDLLKGRLGGML